MPPTEENAGSGHPNARHPSEGRPKPGALAGVRVIDLSRVLGGPYCTQILADHGADVIKIEPPQGDETRGWGPPFAMGLSAYFAGANRNKRCMALDLSSAAGQAVLLKLLGTADVLVENFKPGTLEKWNLGYDEVLARLFPRLIHCRISGFGETGPLGTLPGYDAAAQAWTGIMSINGSEGTGPIRMGLPIVDLAAGLNASFGILAALHERAGSGRGQSLATSLFETGLALLHPHAANFFMSGADPKPTGSAHPNISPYDLFRTKTTPLFLAVGNNGQFAKLCARLGAPALAADPRFLENKDRVAHRADLRAELEARLRDEDGERLAEELLNLGVPAGPVIGVKSAFAQEQARSLRSRLDLDGVGHVAPPVRMSRTPASVRAKAEPFGASTRGVLEEAGYSIEEIRELFAAGVVFGTP